MSGPSPAREPGAATVAVVLAAAPDRVRVAGCPVHPGGGGQVSERGWLTCGPTTATVLGAERPSHGEQGTWLVLGEPAEVHVGDTVAIRVDVEHRQRIQQAHTAAHLLNALVFQRFGALVNGAHIDGDGTARLDVDLAGRGVTNDELRALDGALAELVGRDLPIHERRITAAEADAATSAGLAVVRSLAGAPEPGPDGTVRVVEIRGFDVQACSGTHVHSTGAVGPVRITKVESKGRQNRRIRFALG